MTLVADASFVAAWFLPDENVIIPVGVEFWLVPPIFAYELAHTLRRALRRDRIRRDDVLLGLDALGDLPFSLVADAGLDARDIYDFAERHDLGAYDAAYLRLAMNQGVGLATLDARLADAARKAGIALIGA